MTTIFDALNSTTTSAAKIAAALGISRQAYAQAQKRGRLSDQSTLNAAKILRIKPAAALLANMTGKYIAAPIRKPAAHPITQIQDAKKPPKQQTESTTANNQPTTNYARYDDIKKVTDESRELKKIHSLPQSEKRRFEIDCVKWMLCVPRISPASPRFVQYFSRWVVPEKIAAAKLRGDFDELTKNCPPIAPELLNYIQAGIDEYKIFAARHQKQHSVNHPTPAAVKLPISAKAG